MVKEVTIIKAEGGYILKGVDPTNGAGFLQVHPNFGAVSKQVRAFFGEQKAKTTDEAPQAE